MLKYLRRPLVALAAVSTIGGVATVVPDIVQEVADQAPIALAWGLETSCPNDTWTLVNPENEDATLDNEDVIDANRTETYVVPTGTDDVSATWPGDQIPHWYNRWNSCTPPPEKCPDGTDKPAEGDCAPVDCTNGPDVPNGESCPTHDCAGAATPDGEECPAPPSELAKVVVTVNVPVCGTASYSVSASGKPFGNDIKLVTAYIWADGSAMPGTADSPASGDLVYAAGTVVHLVGSAADTGGGETKSTDEGGSGESVVTIPGACTPPPAECAAGTTHAGDVISGLGDNDGNGTAGEASDCTDKVTPPVKDCTTGMVKDANGACVTPQTPPAATDVCPDMDGDQATVPTDKVKDDAGNCVTPAQPVTKTATSTNAGTTSDIAPYTGGHDDTVNYISAAVGAVLLGIFLLIRRRRPELIPIRLRNKR